MIPPWASLAFWQCLTLLLKLRRDADYIEMVEKRESTWRWCERLDLYSEWPYLNVLAMHFDLL